MINTGKILITGASLRVNATASFQKTQGIYLT